MIFGFYEIVIGALVVAVMFKEDFDKDIEEYLVSFMACNGLMFALKFYILYLTAF